MSPGKQVPRRVPIRYRSTEPMISPRALENIRQVLQDGYLSPGGPWVERFERGWAAVCGVEHAVATSSGTSALYIAMRAAGIGVGDEVVVPSMTCPDTVNAVTIAGAQPVIVEIEPVRYGLDPQRLLEAITARTKAVIPVHLYGCPVDPQVFEIARANELLVIEDAAEAHGAEQDGRKTGALGDIGCFSFRGEKVLGIGTGGMITTNDRTITERARHLIGMAAIGGFDRYFSTEMGYSCEMSNVHAAIGAAQLDVLDETIAAKRRIAAWYHELLPEWMVEHPTSIDGHIWWKYSPLFTTADTRQLHAALLESGIEAMPPFAPLYRLPMHADAYQPDAFPVSERVYRYLLSLPSSPHLSRTQIEEIVTVIQQVVPTCQLKERDPCPG